MYSFRIFTSPRIFYENETWKAAIDTENVSKKEVPPYAPQKVPPEIIEAEKVEKNNTSNLDETFKFAYPDYSNGKSIAENNSDSFKSIEIYLDKMPDSPAKLRMLEQIAAIEKLYDNKMIIKWSTTETQYMGQLITYVNQELITEKQWVMLEKWKVLWEKVQDVQKKESEFLTNNKKYREIHADVTKRIEEWGASTATPDLKDLANQLQWLLLDDNYDGIEKLLQAYKTKKLAQNQIPPEKKSNILKNMRELYKNSHISNFSLENKNPDEMSYDDFMMNAEFMILFRKDVLWAEFIAEESKVSSSPELAFIDKITFSIRDAKNSAEEVTSSAEELMTASTEKDKALAEYNTSIREYQSFVTTSQTFEKQFSEQKVAQTYPNYKVLTSRDIPGTNPNTYELAFAVSQNIRVSDTYSAINYSTYMPPNTKIIIPSSSGGYNYLVSKNQEWNMYFGVPRMGVNYGMEDPARDIPYYTMMAETPIIRDIFKLWKDYFGKYLRAIHTKYKISADLRSDEMLNVIIQDIRSRIPKEIPVGKDMPSNFATEMRASAWIRKYFTPERQRDWRDALKASGIMNKDGKLNTVALGLVR